MEVQVTNELLVISTYDLGQVHFTSPMISGKSLEERLHLLRAPYVLALSSDSPTIYV